MRIFPRRNPRLLFLGLALALLPRPAAAVEPEYVAGPLIVGSVRVLGNKNFRAIVEFEHGYMHFGDLANFTGYRLSFDGQLDEAREYRYKLRDEVMEGFRLGLRFRGQLDLVWSRLWADSAYQVWVDGEEVVNDPEAAIRILLPEVEVRLDMLTLAWRFESLKLAGISPTARAGYGWTLMSQKGPFQAPFRPVVDNSMSADTFELGAGLEGRWSVLQLGAELRGFTFRWETEDPNVPSSQVWSWMWSLRAGLVF